MLLHHHLPHADRGDNLVLPTLHWYTFTENSFCEIKKKKVWLSGNTGGIPGEECTFSGLISDIQLLYLRQTMCECSEAAFKSLFEQFICLHHREHPIPGNYLTWFWQNFNDLFLKISISIICPRCQKQIGKKSHVMCQMYWYIYALFVYQHNQLGFPHFSNKVHVDITGGWVIFFFTLGPELFWVIKYCAIGSEVCIHYIPGTQNNFWKQARIVLPWPLMTPSCSVQQIFEKGI